MGCCNEPAAALASAAPDPTQHVHFAKGMVLGVDDFTQEFAFLAGRDHWLAREAVGFGTLSGLRVFVEDDGADGPRLHVTAGAALVPAGALVCVPADQCATINRWLAKPANAAKVSGLLGPDSPPVSPPAAGAGTISLFLTLCASSCLTRPVPIPGEPCRSEDQLMAPSRVADDFRLELRAEAPEQPEEDALRDFVRWLRDHVTVADGSPPPPDGDEEWLEMLRPAAEPWLAKQDASPPPSYATLGDYLFDLSPPELAVAPDRLADFLRVAFRFWVTELRPLWMARRCHRPAFADNDCVLLARVELDVVWSGGSPAGAWQVDGSPAVVTIDETTRPVLVHQRLLQEWLLAGPSAAAPAGGGGAAAGGTTVPLDSASADLALDGTHGCVLCRGGAALTLALPAADAGSAGRVYLLKNVDAGAVTVEAAAGEQVEGAASITIAAGEARTLVGDGAGAWHVVASTA
jgi:hypothetical protein